MRPILSRHGNAALCTCKGKDTTAVKICYLSLIEKGHGFARLIESHNMGVKTYERSYTNIFRWVPLWIPNVYHNANGLEVYY